MLTLLSLLTKLKTFNLLLGSIANYRQEKAKLGENERSLHTPSCRENHAICTHFRCLLLGFSLCSMAPPESVQVPRGKGAVAWSGWGSFGHCSHVVNINKYCFNCFEILIGEIYSVVLSKLPVSILITNI